jgi:hypothetical protein
MKRSLLLRVRWWWMPLLVAALALVSIGVGRGEWEKVATWAGMVCSSCIGLSPVQ